MDEREYGRKNHPIFIFAAVYISIVIKDISFEWRNIRFESTQNHYSHSI